MKQQRVFDFLLGFKIVARARFFRTGANESLKF